MPLDKSSLTTALESALGAGESGLDSASKANIEQVASDMADAIDTFVKTGLVTIPVTSPVGTPSTGNIT